MLTHLLRVNSSTSSRLTGLFPIAGRLVSVYASDLGLHSLPVTLLRDGGGGGGILQTEMG